MAVATKEYLSGGAGDGTQIKITQTATAGTTVHTGHATATDELWLYAHNTHTAAVVVTIEWAGVTDPDDIMSIPVPIDDGWTLIVPGFAVPASGVVGVFAGQANVVLVQGYVNRLT